MRPPSRVKLSTKGKQSINSKKLCLSILNNVAQAKQHQFSNLDFENSRIREKDWFYLYSHLLRKTCLCSNFFWMKGILILFFSELLGGHLVACIKRNFIKTKDYKIKDMTLNTKSHKRLTCSVCCLLATTERESIIVHFNPFWSTNERTEIKLKIYLSEA